MDAADALEAALDAGDLDAPALDARPTDAFGLDAGPTVDAFAPAWDVGSADASVSTSPRILALSVGGHSTCVIDRLHRVWCWGLYFAEVPTRVADWSDATAVSASSESYCAVRGGAEVWCWESTPRPGTPLITTPHRFMPTWPAPISQIGVGGSAICGLTADGVRCAGTGLVALESDGLAPIDTLPDTVEIAISENFGCARDSAGAVRCWGSNSQGQLGDGSLLDRRRPTLVSALGPATRLQVGGYSTCALVEGMGWCWGYNDLANLGDGTTTDRTMPTRVVTADFVDITQGWFHGAGVQSDGTVLEWGSDRASSPPSPVLTPRPVAAMPPARAVEAGYSHACALGRDGEVYCWGGAYLGRPGGPSAEASRVYFPCEPSCPADSLCVEGECVPTAPPADAGVSGGPVVSIANGCAAHASGQVTCWGPGFLGDGLAEAPSRTPPQLVSSIPDGVEVVATARTRCVRRSDGSVWCWGANTFGEVGDGTTAERRTPVRVVELPPVTHILRLFDTFVAIDESGDAWLWGDDSGDMARASDGGRLRTRPVRIAGLANVRDVGIGPCRTTTGRNGWAAVDSSGTVRCWGGGSAPFETLVVDSTLRTLTRNSAGAPPFGCALGDDLRCWGWVGGRTVTMDTTITDYRGARAACDHHGRLLIVDSFGDTYVDGSVAIIPAAASCSDSCVITEAGEAWCSESSTAFVRVRTL